MEWTTTRRRCPGGGVELFRQLNQSSFPTFLQLPFHQRVHEFVYCRQARHPGRYTGGSNTVRIKLEIKMTPFIMCTAVHRETPVLLLVSPAVTRFLSFKIFSTRSSSTQLTTIYSRCRVLVQLLVLSPVSLPRGSVMNCNLSLPPVRLNGQSSMQLFLLKPTQPQQKNRPRRSNATVHPFDQRLTYCRHHPSMPSGHYLFCLL